MKDIVFSEKEMFVIAFYRKLNREEMIALLEDDLMPLIDDYAGDYAGSPTFAQQKMMLEMIIWKLRQISDIDYQCLNYAPYEMLLDQAVAISYDVERQVEGDFKHEGEAIDISGRPATKLS